MKLFIYITFLVSISLSSCKKNTNESDHSLDCHMIYLSSEISNFRFKKGSYWVYIDSVNLSIDTMKIDTVLFDGFSSTPSCRKNLEYYSFRVNNGSPKNVYSLQGNKFFLNQTDIVGTGTEIYIDSSPKMDSMFVFDRYYKSVVINTHPHELSENNNKTIFYTNTTYGFLKKEVYNSSNQLISKKLLKDKFILR